MKPNYIKHLLIFCVTPLLGSGPTMALAHTEVQFQATEGVLQDNAIKIGHGCENPPAAPKPVIAQSIVFPQKNLTGIIQEKSLVGLMDTIQDNRIFKLQAEKVDALGNVYGFEHRNGSLKTTSQGRVPFEFTPPNFEPASCVKTLKVQLAIADICVTTAPTIQAGKVNLWIPNNGSTYAKLGTAAGVDGVGDPPVLVIHRNLKTNPFTNPSCGTGKDLTIAPTAAEIDAHLGIPGYWSN